MDKNEEEQKERKLPDLTLFEQANSEIALAASRANSHFALESGEDCPSFEPARLSTIVSEGEESEEEEAEVRSEEEGNDYEYFDFINGIGEGEDEFGEFLGNEEDTTLDEMEEDDDNYLEEDEIDPDELSYEELIALGEFIGTEKRGLAPNEISTCLREFKYVSTQMMSSGIDRCVVCQMEFEEEGTDLVLLRPCDHPYHSECVTKWLQTKKICPICGSEPSLT